MPRLAPEAIRLGIPEFPLLDSNVAASSDLPGNDVQTYEDPLFLSTNEQETSIAVDPTDPQVVVGIMQGTIPDSVTRVWSGDGGQTWQSGGIPDASGDPVVTVDGSGNFYTVALQAGTETEPGGVAVTRSSDGGATVSPSVFVLREAVDKPYITADPADGSVHVTWGGSDIPGGFFGYLSYSRSTDGGQTFSTPVLLSNEESLGNGAFPVIGPNGEVYVVWGLNDENLWFDRSLDGGLTWLADDILVATYVPVRNPLKEVQRNASIPAMAVDLTDGPFRGRIYLVYPDQPGGDPDIVLRWSDDQGSTWSDALRVNDDAPGNDADQFFPMVVVDGDGAVHVAFFDRREDPDGLLVGMYVASSEDGGASFGPNVRISDLIFDPPGASVFLGDYIGAAASTAGRLHVLWPDGRSGDLDIYTRSVDTADYDEDGLLNAADNCPGIANPGQADQDLDGIGDDCDACPSANDPSNFDLDRDGQGDVCDPCPRQVGGDATDEDGDGELACNDNCPLAPNADQSDLDADGTGDACDPYPTDADDDGVDAAVDNCVTIFNPRQVDTDNDGVGDACDICPDASDADQLDRDGDGLGDACDCQPGDDGDREPAAIMLRVDEGPGGTELSWNALAAADGYGVTRGLASELARGAYGACFADGLFLLSVEDAEIPPVGDAFTYLVAGQNVECGQGDLGSLEPAERRRNDDAAACAGPVATDRYAISEESVFGTVSGSLSDTFASDDLHETITEVSRTQSGKTWEDLDHQWTFDVAAGTRIELHLESFRPGPGESFRLEYATGGTQNWTFLSTLAPPREPGEAERVITVPNTVSGQFTLRVTDNTGFPFGDEVRSDLGIDEIFVRTLGD